MGTSHRNRVEEGRAFFRRLGQEGAWAPVFVITGEERFLVDTAIARLEEAAFPGGVDEMNRLVFRGSEARAMDVVTAAQMLPMFASRRLVVAREMGAWNAEDMGLVAAYAASPSETTLLVLEAVSLDRRLSAVQRLVKAAEVASVDFPALYERDVVSWVARRARTRGLVLARDVPGWLVEALGTSLGALDGALERIDLYLGGEGERQVTLEVVQEVIVDTRTRGVFELVDAIAARDLGLAAETVNRMLERSEAPIGMVAMIARQFRQLLLVQEGRRRGLSGNPLASFAGCPPFRLSDLERNASRFGPGELADLLRRCMEVDRSLKSSRLPDRIHVEALLVGACGTIRR